MKNLIIWALGIYTGFAGSCLAQNLKLFNGPIEEVIYTASYRETLNTESYGESEDYSLLIGKNYTLYMSSSRLKIDSSLYKTNDIEAAMSIMGAYPAAPREKILVDRNQRFCYFIDTPVTTHLYYEQPIKMNWVIAPETKKIAGMSCQKATTKFSGRDYVAWFSQSVPLPVGPYKFMGLPGIIVSVQDTEGKFKFELTSFAESKTKRWINLYEKSTPMKSTQAEMRKMVVSLLTNPTHTLNSIPGVSVSGESLQNMKPSPIPEFMEIIEY